jgi:hypothetical protein
MIDPARLPYMPVGMILPLFCDSDEIPPGFYLCNHAQVLLSSAEGQALNNLSTTLKANLGITVSAPYICLPSMFDDGGRGYVIRAVDGNTRAPGSKQEDAIRNITGSSYVYGTKYKSDLASSGAYFDRTVAYSNFTFNTTAINDRDWMYVPDFDASRDVPTADENRMLNIGALFCIWLGV